MAEQARDALDQEHAGIDGKRDPQDASETIVARRRWSVMLAAGIGHLVLVALRLGHMLEHVNDDAADVIVGRRMEYLLAMTLRAQQRLHRQAPTGYRVSYRTLVIMPAAM
jgi:hypothetical protein